MRFRCPFFPAEQYVRVSPSLAERILALPEAPEGHISPDQAEFLYHLVRLTKPTFVVETGFCVGHSACVIMEAQRSLGIEPNLLSVDHCTFDATKTASALVRSWYSGFIFVEGNTRDVLAEAIHTYLRQYEGVLLGLGVIDGGHDSATVRHDLETISSFLCLGGYIWLDDYEKIVPCAGVNHAGREFSRTWGNSIHFRTADMRGFMLHQKSL